MTGNQKSGPCSDSHDLESLIQGLCDQTLSPQEQAQLKQRLCDDPQAREIYCDWMQLHGEIAWQLAPAEPFSAAQLRRFELVESAFATGPPVVEDLAAVTSSAVPRLLSPATLLAHPWQFGAAVMAINAALWLVFFSTIFSGRRPVLQPQDVRPETWSTGYVAQLLAPSDDCQWVPGSDPAEAGELLAPGRNLELAAGEVKIIFGDRSTVVLEGPVSFKLVSLQAGHLQQGRLTAKATSGFTIHTPSATVRDLGTEFGVAVDRLWQTRVAVFAGRVAIHSASGRIDRQLIAGESIRIGAGGRLLADAGLAAVDRFAQELVARSPAKGGGLLKVDTVAKTDEFRVDLTARGPIDWAYWDNGKLEKADQKAAPQVPIGELTLLGAPTPYDFGGRYHGQYLWSDGTQNTASPDQMFGMVQAVKCGAGDGFRLTVPADTVARTLTLFLGTFQAAGRLTARLSDQSAHACIEEMQDDGAYLVMIDYRAASPGQELAIDWIATAVTGPNSNVLVQAAALGPAVADANTAASGLNTEKLDGKADHGLE